IQQEAQSSTDTVPSVNIASLPPPIREAQFDKSLVDRIAGSEKGAFDKAPEGSVETIDGVPVIRTDRMTNEGFLLWVDQNLPHIEKVASGSLKPRDIAEAQLALEYRQRLKSVEARNKLAQAEGELYLAGPHPTLRGVGNPLKRYSAQAELAAG